MQASSLDSPLPAGFSEAYTLSGCAVSAHCGVFRRVLARCVSGRYCPGGYFHYSASTDPSLCDGAPVYQQEGGGFVLHRTPRSSYDGRTYWMLATPDALETCDDTWYGLYSAISDYPGPPTLAAYSNGPNDNGGTGWNVYQSAFVDWCHSGCGITVVAGGR